MATAGPADFSEDGYHGRAVLVARTELPAMRLVAFLLLLKLFAPACLYGVEEPAFDGEFPPASVPAHRGLRWPRILAPARRPPPLTSHGILQPHGHTDAGPSAWFGHTMGAPTYNWGHFGVKARPYWVNQGSYHGDHGGWSYRRGY